MDLLSNSQQGVNVNGSCSDWSNNISLSNSQQGVNVNGSCSDWSNNISDVPQRSLECA